MCRDWGLEEQALHPATPIYIRGQAPLTRHGAFCMDVRWLYRGCVAYNWHGPRTGANGEGKGEEERIMEISFVKSFTEKAGVMRVSGSRPPILPGGVWISACPWALTAIGAWTPVALANIFCGELFSNTGLAIRTKPVLRGEYRNSRGIRKLRWLT